MSLLWYIYVHNLQSLHFEQCHSSSNRRNATIYMVAFSLQGAYNLVPFCPKLCLIPEPVEWVGWGSQIACYSTMELKPVYLLVFLIQNKRRCMQLVFLTNKQVAQATVIVGLHKGHIRQNRTHCTPIIEKGRDRGGGRKRACLKVDEEWNKKDAEGWKGSRNPISCWTWFVHKMEHGHERNL